MNKRWVLRSKGYWVLAVNGTEVATIRRQPSDWGNWRLTTIGCKQVRIGQLRELVRLATEAWQRTSIPATDAILTLAA